MADVQLENGFYRIANELGEAFARTRLDGREYQIVFAVMRLTYGFGKKSDAISHGQISKLTGLPRTKVVKLVGKLISRKVLASAPQGTRKPSILRINKDYDKWLPSPPQGTSPLQGTRNSPLQGTTPSPLQGTLQRKNKRKKKDIVPFSGNDCANPDDNGFDEFWKHYPARGVPKKKQGKEQALKTWNRLHKEKQLPVMNRLLELLDSEIQSRQWMDPQYIPFASTWLNRKPWQDGECELSERTNSILDNINMEDLEIVYAE